MLRSDFDNLDNLLSGESRPFIILQPNWNKKLCSQSVSWNQNIYNRSEKLIHVHQNEKKMI